VRAGQNSSNSCINTRNEARIGGLRVSNAGRGEGLQRALDQDRAMTGAGLTNWVRPGYAGELSPFPTPAFVRVTVVDRSRDYRIREALDRAPTPGEVKAHP